jgi:hypothetical protein
MNLEIYIFILLGMNVLLMAYIFYDRFILLRKHSKRIAEDVFQQGLQQSLEQFDAVMLKFKSEVTDTISKSRSTSDTIAQELEQDLQVIHTQEIQKVQDFSQELYRILLDTTELIKAEMQQYIQRNKEDITSWSDLYKKAMKDSSDQMLTAERDLLTQYIEDERVNTRGMLKEMVLRDIDTICRDVIKNGITIQDQEILVLNAINLYLKDSRP